MTNIYKKKSKKKILLIFGTRPEAIKIAPLYFNLKQEKRLFKVKVCVTAQQREMLDQVIKLFRIKVDYDLNIMRDDQDLFDTTSLILNNIKKIIKKTKPNLVIVHGDTTTSFASALAAFYSKIKVAHVEAGLRTYNLFAPYPEEFNRQSISKLSNFHFAPTKTSKINLLNENVSSKSIFVTGNTVVDSLKMIKDAARVKKFSNQTQSLLPFLKNDSQILLVTGHRRENFGRGFKEICTALKKIAEKNKDLNIVYPVHLNPNVQKPVNEILKNIKNIYLIEPLDYMEFVKLMDRSYIILTDSGGIQEEAPSFGKPVLVMREATERPEGLEAGLIKLVGSKSQNIVKEVEKLLKNKKNYLKMISNHNPYGDGKASMRIVKILKSIKL